MTREELFHAVGEVREDLVEGAEAMGGASRPPWRRYGALAACLAAALVGVTAAGLRGSDPWKAVADRFQTCVIEEDLGDAGAADAAGAAAGGLDGCEYAHPSEPLRPSYSTGVEIGELGGPGDGSKMIGTSSCAAWWSPEEIFARDTAIFRGTVEDLQYFQVESETGLMKDYYTRVSVKVTDSIRGGLAEGETYALLYMGAKGYMSTSLMGPLEDLEVGGEAVFMPIRTDRDTGRREGDSYFCYADLAELYLGEGMRFVFAETAEGLAFERSVYEEIAGAEDLDEVAAYIRSMIGGTERTQPAAVPAEPQAEPSETRQASQAETDPSRLPDGPNGAREVPGGAFVGE